LNLRDPGEKILHKKNTETIPVCPIKKLRSST
jgi:hypothetical protein